jgi:hypothetical protein
LKNHSLANFCECLASSDLSIGQRALAIFFWHGENAKRSEMSSGEIAKVMYAYGLGSPNSTKLKEAMARTRLATRSGNVFRLKAEGRKEIQKWLAPILGKNAPDIDHGSGFLPSAIWEETRGYLEKVCAQLNGCYECNFPDAAAVLVRRVIETLIIEAYVHVNRDAEIKGADGNYLMLSGLIDKAVSLTGLPLGRDSKKHLGAIKELGDRSAHKRNYNAVKADLDKIQTPLRVTVDELINLANLRRQK